MVVSDGVRVLADLARAGDEPLMLARSVPGAGVFVCPDRFWPAPLAERRFGATVHLLDDGFQHLALARDVDLAVVVGRRRARSRRCRAAACASRSAPCRHADALLVTGETPADGRGAGGALGRGRTPSPRAASGGAARWSSRGAAPCGCRAIGRSSPSPASPGPSASSPISSAAGWPLVDRAGVPRSPPFTARDVAAIAGRVRETGAAAVLTTEKDAVRLLPLRPLPFAAAFVPLTVTIEPEDVFTRGCWTGWRRSPRRG